VRLRLPGLLGPLVDYGDDEEEDTLPLRGGLTFMQSAALSVERTRLMRFLRLLF